MFITNTLTANFIGLIVSVLVILIAYCKWKYQHWSRRNIPFFEPHIPYGNVAKALRGKEHITVSLKKIYNEMKRKGWKYGGIFVFTKPNFLAIDLDIIKNILIKDFDYFSDRDVYSREKDPLQAHLLNLTGAKWKNLRSKLTPTFTSGKIKMMFNVMVECQNDLYKRMDTELAKKKPINIKEILACFATNIIGSCAFGLDCKALESENSEFRHMGKLLFTPSKAFQFKSLFCVTFPGVAKFFDISLSQKNVASFVINMVENTIHYREKNKYTRNDFLQMMIQLKNQDKDSLTLDEIASQCIVFFAAGFETSSTLMTFVLYELSKHQDVQNKLRNEINTVLTKYGKQLTYDSIQDMRYLNQVVEETLRMHPPGASLTRKCVKDYKVPGENVIIEKGTTVKIPTLGIHYDEDIYPNPTKFDPERFSSENKNRRHNCAHMPFGDGPRNCIGMRFGLLQSKVGLVSLLNKYKFTVNNKTQEPLFYNPNSTLLVVKGEVWLDVQKI